jgi:hypothetical protein
VALDVACAVLALAIGLVHVMSRRDVLVHEKWSDAFGEPHDLEHIEAAFSGPDAFLLIPPARRVARARHGDDGCILVAEDGSTLTYYVRTVLRVPIRGEARFIGWGVLAEVDHGS